MIKSANKSFFIIEKMKKYRKCPALERSVLELSLQHLLLKASQCTRGTKESAFSALMG